MDHAEAERQMLSERYLLNELAPEAREEFEEHFFSCQQCALDLEAGAAFLDHSKAVLSSPIRSEALKPVPHMKQRFWSRLRPAFALPLLGLVILISYQSFVVFPRLRHSARLAERPQLLPALSLINVGARGDNQAALLARKGEPFLLFVDIPGDSRFLNYVASLQDSAGREVWSLKIPEAATKDTISIQVPGRDAAGEYTLVVRGENSRQATEVGRYPFNLQFQQ
jgi:hypothetical protein